MTVQNQGACDPGARIYRKWDTDRRAIDWGRVHVEADQRRPFGRRKK